MGERFVPKTKFETSSFCSGGACAGVNENEETRTVSIAKLVDGKVTGSPREFSPTEWALRSNLVRLGFPTRMLLPKGAEFDTDEKRALRLGLRNGEFRFSKINAPRPGGA